jgi:hypothetical protein
MKLINSAKIRTTKTNPILRHGSALQVESPEFKLQTYGGRVGDHEIDHLKALYLRRKFYL